MALILAYYKQNNIFYIVSGYESSYNKRKDIPIGTPNDEEFVKQDKEWIDNSETQYTIDYKSTAQRAGRYSIRRNNGIFGFPKGGLKSDETSLDAAVREFGEEVGYNLDRSKLNALKQSDYTIYTYDVSTAAPDEKQAIITAIATMKKNRKGELFEVMFRSLENINKERKINAKSREALAAFKVFIGQLGGSRKWKSKSKSKSTRRKRAKRQTLK